MNLMRKMSWFRGVGRVDIKAAPARKHGIRRRIVEFCCGHESLIGQRAPADTDVVRLTIDDDLTTDAGLAKALAAVSDPDVPTLLFGALPCTGGSPYQHLNWYRGEKTRAKIREHRRIFKKLWKNFELVAEACIAAGGKVAIEWPRNCTYWKLFRVRQFIRRHDLHEYKLDGCMYNLRSKVKQKYGKLLTKPWSIYSNCDEFWRMANTCNHVDRACTHVKTEGPDTKMTEGYTVEMADAIHMCWSRHA